MATKVPKQPTYQELQAELSDLLSRLESAEIDIDAAVAAYQRGQEIIEQLESTILGAEHKIEKLRAARQQDAA